MKKLLQSRTLLIFLFAMGGVALLVGYKVTYGSTSKVKEEKKIPIKKKQGKISKVAEEKIPIKEETTNTPVEQKQRAVIETDKGNMTIEFYHEVAPETVKRISELIQKGFYNGLSFHRVEPGFVIQGGDPDANGRGGSGENIKAEFNSRKHIRGTVAMARSTDPNSADSQFYIALAPQPSLDGEYTVFGQVVEGMDVIDKIAVGDVMKRVYLEPTQPN